MGLFLYLSNTGEVTGHIENVSSQEAEEIAISSAETTLYLENAEFPVYKKGYVIKHDGTEFYYEEIPMSEFAEAELTETELIQAEILLNQADILAKQNEQDEVLATILLNQMGV